MGRGGCEYRCAEGFGPAGQFIEVAALRVVILVKAEAGVEAAVGDEFLPGREHS